MKLASIVIPLILSFSCNSNTISNIRTDLENRSSKDSSRKSTMQAKQRRAKTITIIVSYAAIECGCPQWFESKFQKQSFLKGVERFYLEPTNKTIVNANNLWDGQTLPLRLKLVGRFSDNKELPKTYNSKMIPEKARIFWYNKIDIISGLKR